MPNEAPDLRPQSHIEEATPIFKEGTPKNNRFSPKFIIGALVAIGLMAIGMILEGGHISSMIQLTAFLIVMGPTAAFLFAVYPSRAALDIGNIALGKKTQTPVSQMADLFNGLGTTALTSGMIGTFLGAIHVMENLDRPEMIGPGVAVAFISLLYGAGFKMMIANPLAAMAEHRADSDGGKQQQTPLHRGSLLKVIMGTICGTLALFGGLILEGGHVASVIQFTSALVVAGPILGVEIMLGSRMVPHIPQLMKFPELTQKQAILAAKRFKTLAATAIVAGVIGTIFGLIHVMENLDQPDKIGFGIAIAMIPMVYGSAMFIFFSVYQHIYRSRAIASQSDLKLDPSHNGVIGFAMASLFFLLFVTFVVLYAIRVS